MFSSYTHVDAIRNNYRHVDLTENVCNIHLRAQFLCLQFCVLNSILQHLVTPKKGHPEEITYLDIALIDYLLWGCPINLGYIIIRHMLSFPTVTNRSFSYDNFMIRILKHFRVPIDKHTFEPTKPLGDKAICSLGFDWRNEQ